MTQELALTDAEDRATTLGDDWAFAFTISGSVITAVSEARMEIRRVSSRLSPIIASFYSDGSGTGTLTIGEDGLTVTIELPAAVTDDEDTFSFVGEAHYDVDITYQGGKKIRLLRGPVEVLPRVTQ